MERLTSNKDVSEMGMFELAYNSCYIKDGKARYRDYDLDIDARDFARELLKDYADGDDAFTCDEDFDNWMVDYLKDGTDGIEGLIALFYRNLWAMADLREELKRYEDLKEQGKIPEPSCVVGDKIWSITSLEDYSSGEYKENLLVHPQEKKIVSITMSKNGILYHVKDRAFAGFEFGETVFLTKEEAEQALKEMEAEEK